MGRPIVAVCVKAGPAKVQNSRQNTGCCGSPAKHAEVGKKITRPFITARSETEPPHHERLSNLICKARSLVVP